MKKLSLLLALLLALSVCLVACGGGESDATEDNAPSNAVSEDASTDASTDASEDTSADASEDASEDVSEDEGGVDVNGEITGENIAPNATYTLSQLYRQGDASTDWGYDETKPESYPDEEGVSLVDGAFATVLDFTDPAWIGFHQRCPDYQTNGYSSITFDLGAATAITGVKAYVGTDALGGGIIAPSAIEFYVSEDGENWTLVNIGTPLNAGDEFGTECVEIAAATTTQYVQLRFQGAGWMFISEIEIFA
ncbi:MAG: discoidin domain-containing protein [Clostridia bacterium]|nr:discoidin domain-containing protein [Clostridia bacterium]